MSDSEMEVLLLAGRFEVRGSSAYTLRLAAGLESEAISARIVATDARRVNPQIYQRLKISCRFQRPRYAPLGRVGFQDTAQRDTPAAAAHDSYSIAACPAIGNAVGAGDPQAVCADDARTRRRRFAAAARPPILPADHRRQ